MNEIKKAVEVLKKGGIVIFPTDTAFGIGCRIDDEDAIERLFKIRRRPKAKATPVLFSNIDMVKKYVKEIPQDAKKLMEKYWPGALTIILDSNRANVPLLVRGGGETLGVRIPNSEVAQTIISEVGVPILGPSANFHGEKTPYEFRDLNPQLLKLVDYAVKGECLLKKSSTVIDCSQKPWKVLRKGAVEIENLKLKVENITLLIDTINNKKVAVGLRIGNEINWLRKDINFNQTQVALPMIDKILKDKNIKIKDVDEINVNMEEGSFTGRRIGESIGNALSFALGIPVNFTKFSDILKI